jgi:hypothetical protein
LLEASFYLYSPFSFVKTTADDVDPITKYTTRKTMGTTLILDNGVPDTDIQPIIMAAIRAVNAGQPKCKVNFVLNSRDKEPSLGSFENKNTRTRDIVRSTYSPMG